MSGFTEHEASEAGERLDRYSPIVNLDTARRMLPLLRRIIADILLQRRILAELARELEWLDRQKQTLTWPLRQRRYQLHEDSGSATRSLGDALAELEVLGVALIDSEEGQVGLPTVVNSRLAYFSWRHGENTIAFWHFPGETIRRPIPANWNDTSALPVKGHG